MKQYVFFIAAFRYMVRLQTIKDDMLGDRFFIRAFSEEKDIEKRPYWSELEDGSSQFQTVKDEALMRLLCLDGEDVA